MLKTRVSITYSGTILQLHVPATSAQLQWITLFIRTLKA